MAAFEFLLKNWSESGWLRSKLIVLKMSCSIFFICPFVYELSVIYTKSPTSGAYVSSYFDAKSMALTPTNCNFDLFTIWCCGMRTMDNMNFSEVCIRNNLLLDKESIYQSVLYAHKGRIWDYTHTSTIYM